MMLCLTLFIRLLIYIANAGASYPQNPKQTLKEYRKIKVEWDDVEGATMYQIEYKIIDPPRYAVNQLSASEFKAEPTILFENLLANTNMSVRIKVYNNNSPFSPYFNATSRPTSDVPSDLVLPNKVGLIEYVSADNVIWRAPNNVIGVALNPLVKSVQYRVELCYFNPLDGNTTNCNIIAVVAGNPNSVTQSITQSKRSIYVANPQIPENRDVRVTITPIALNLKEGPSEWKIWRINKLSVPTPPLGLQQISSTFDGINLKWASADSSDSSIKYMVKYGLVNDTLNTSTTLVSQPKIELTDLVIGRSYTIQVAIYDSKKGASGFSNPITATAERGNKPTTNSSPNPSPNSSPNPSPNSSPNPSSNPSPNSSPNPDSKSSSNHFLLDMTAVTIAFMAAIINF